MLLIKESDGDIMKNLYYYKHNPIVKKIFFAMLVPTILMNLTTALASFADTVIIGYFLDDLSLSVVTFATPIYMIINTFAALYAVGGSIAMGIDSGKADKQASNKVFSISIELLVFTGCLLIVAGVFFGKQITTLLGAGDEVFDMVYTYSMIVLIGAPIFMLNIGLAFFVRNDGRPTLSMVGMFLSIAVNIVFDIVFIGVFDMGVAGAAYATVLGQLISVLVIASHFLTRKNTLKFRFALDLAVLRIVKNGVSTALHFVYQFLSILILNHYVVNLAVTDGVVIYTVVFNLYTVSLALFEGLSQTIQPMVSVYYGERSFGKIRNTLRLVFLATIVMCGAVTVLLEIVPQIVPTVFGISDPNLLMHSSLAVRIYATSMIIMTFNVIIGYYLQSTENNSMAAILVSLRCLVLFLESAFVLGRLFGMNGVWGAYTMAEVLTFICFIFMNAGKRKKFSKQGIDADIFLLDNETIKNTYCFTCDCQKDNFDEFKVKLLEQTKKCDKIKQSVFLDMEQYLTKLEKCIADKKGEYIEVELNLCDCKVIIRDNLNHESIADVVAQCISNDSKAEYGPVLGWNRLCL